MSAEKLSDSELSRLKSVVNVGAPKMAMQKPAARMPQKVPRAAAPKAPHGQHADPDSQLFVRIEEHDKVGNDLHKAREDIKTIASTIELLARAEKLKAEAIDRMEQHVANFDSLLQKIEGRIIPPDDILEQGMETRAETAGTAARTNVAADIKSLSSDLKSLKDTLSKLK